MKNNNNSIERQSNSKQVCVEIDLGNLPIDSCLRKRKINYHPNDRDEIQMAYVQKGTCQTVNHDFPKRQFEKNMALIN
jgi:hypothetical protein